MCPEATTYFAQRVGLYRRRGMTNTVTSIVSARDPRPEKLMSGVKLGGIVRHKIALPRDMPGP